jgi:hypothetical protein
LLLENVSLLLFQSFKLILLIIAHLFLEPLLRIARDGQEEPLVLIVAEDFGIAWLCWGRDHGLEHIGIIFLVQCLLLFLEIQLQKAKAHEVPELKIIYKRLYTYSWMAFEDRRSFLEASKGFLESVYFIQSLKKFMFRCLTSP